MTPEHLTVLRRLASGEDNSDLYPEERAALAALLATFERLEKEGQWWGVMAGAGWVHVPVDSREMAEHIAKRVSHVWRPRVVPLTLAAMLEDEGKVNDVR